MTGFRKHHRKHGPRPKQNRPPEDEGLKGKPVRHEPDWSQQCSTCGASPVHPLTGLCGPCTFGEADTMGGNW
jgi:ribosomal protein L37E